MIDRNLKKDIIYLGDSHSVMEMGKCLLKRMIGYFDSKNIRSDIYFYAITGCTFLDWFNEKQWVYRIANYTYTPETHGVKSTEAVNISIWNKIHFTNPQILILALGSNDFLINGDHFSEYLSEVENKLDLILERFKEIQIVWILPPEFPFFPKFDLLRKALRHMLSTKARVDIVDLKGHFPDQEDQIHFNKVKGNIFGEQIYLNLELILDKVTSRWKVL